jgi:holin-like protein
MNELTGLAWLLLCQSAGEAVSRLLHLRLPGPVIGMLMLLVALQWQFVRIPAGAAAEVLLTHLSLLFVPVGLGVITHVDLILQFGLRILLVVVLSTWIGLAVTAVTLRALLRRNPLPDSR